MSDIGNFYVFVADDSRNWLEFFSGNCQCISEKKDLNFPMHVAKVMSLFEDYKGEICFKKAYEIVGISKDELRMNSALLSFSGFIRSDLNDPIYVNMISAISAYEQFKKCFSDFHHAHEALSELDMGDDDGAIGRFTESVAIDENNALYFFESTDDALLHLCEAFQERGFVYVS